jgi:hypothetical protein
MINEGLSKGVLGSQLQDVTRMIILRGVQGTEEHLAEGFERSLLNNSASPVPPCDTWIQNNVSSRTDSGRPAPQGRCLRYQQSTQVYEIPAGHRLRCTLFPFGHKDQGERLQCLEKPWHVCSSGNVLGSGRLHIHPERMGYCLSELQ